MAVIFKDIVKSYDGIEIFEGISGQINEEDKVGLIGINGIGKTTLVKILIGEEEYDSGTVKYLPQDLKVGYLKQSSEFNADVTVHDKLNSFAHAVTASANSGSYSKKLKNSLIKLGFKERDMNKKVSKLSGGEKTKLSICMVLAENPDILILDEPTNHLDVETIKWLENFINNIKKTMIIISHDRLFLDNTVNKIFEMQENELKEYKGNYTAYRNQKELTRRHLQKEHEKQSKEIKKLEQVIDERMQWFKKAQKGEKADREFDGNRFKKKSSNKHVKIVKSKKIKLEKLKSNKIEIPKEDISAAFEIINKNNLENEKLPKYLVKVNRLKKSFGSRVIFDNAAFNVRNGDKAALIGKNGTGKTTLLKMLLKMEKPDSGSININHSLKVGYFSQELENLNLNNTILDEILECGISRKDARNVLACLLFRGNDIFKTVDKLSMGEKCRVAFGKLLTSGRNILILDEPTNHMDIVSKENIEEVLKEYKGTVIFVSHDRYFVKSIANRIFEIEDHVIKSYEGNYNYYLNKKYEEEKKKKVGENYGKIKDEIIKLECEMACLSAKLNRKRMITEEKEEILDEFFATAEKLEECRKLIKAV